MAVEFWRCCALLQGEEKTLQEEDNEQQQPSEPKVSQVGCRDHVGFRFRWNGSILDWQAMESRECTIVYVCCLVSLQMNVLFRSAGFISSMSDASSRDVKSV